MRRTGQPYLDVVSGAYHDAMVLGAQVPMGMIFVPSVGGISHSPLEYTAPEDIDRGVQVLAAALGGSPATRSVPVALDARAVQELVLDDVLVHEHGRLDRRAREDGGRDHRVVEP